MNHDLVIPNGYMHLMQLAADMQRFSRPERLVNGPTITHFWFVFYIDLSFIQYFLFFLLKYYMIFQKVCLFLINDICFMMCIGLC